MPSPVIHEGFYTGEFMVSEAPGNLSRDAGLIDNSTNAQVLFSAGLIVVQATAGAATGQAVAGNTGNGTITAVSALSGAKFGTYTATFTDATDFTVADPGGNEVGTGTAGAAFSTQVGFTISGGGTAFVAGDSFTISVSETSGAWMSWTGGAIPVNSANQPLIGILYNQTWANANDAAECTIVCRNAEVNLAELQWDPAVTNSSSAASLQATAIAALAQLNIIAR